MRTFINLTVYILIISGFYSCNGDVFVDDFRTSDTELSLDGNGDVAIIHFASSNWDYLELYIYDSSFIGPLKVYDENDNLIADESSPYLKGLGKIVSKNELTDFTIERANPKELKITVGENVRPYSMHLMLIASNEYERQEIYVEILPSDRYVIDHIDYSLNAYTTDKTLDAMSFRLHNYTDIPYTYKLSPYENVYYEVTFKSDEPEAFRLFEGGDLTVHIPSVVNEHLVMNGMQAQYTSARQSLPFPNKDEQKEITIPPMTSQEIYLMIDFMWFETRYTLHAIHPKTKKERIITGKLVGIMPVSYRYAKPKNTNE